MKRILLFILFYIYSITTNAQCYETLTFGGGHTIGKMSNGTLWGWGYGAAGQLYTVNETEPNPIQLGNTNDWNIVKNGVLNTFAIKNNGTLWGCGGNQYGSLGVNSSTQNFTSFQQITTAFNWVKVAPSYFFTIALKADGTIWAWGQNNNYQLGNSPASPQQLFPIQVGTATDWIDIATSHGDTAFAIKSDGTIWGWGANTGYLLYPGSSVTTVSTPTQIGNATDWSKMSVGGGHILVQKQDGTLWSWGGGTALGIGDNPSAGTTPNQITTDIWKSFSTGTNTSFGIKNDGTLWAWGSNNVGQLGDGTNIERTIPTQIGTDTNWDTVQTRNFYTTMATKTDGTIWYWGTNYYGEFGNGISYDTNYYNTPQQTAGICVNVLATPSFEKENILSLYPNPAKDLITIQYDLDIENAIVEVYDISGRSMQEKVLSSPKGVLELNTTNFQAGIYIVVVKQNETIFLQQKIIIE